MQHLYDRYSHPVGASGLRITMTLLNELPRRRRGGSYRIAVIYDGLAQGDAVVVKVE